MADMEGETIIAADWETETLTEYRARMESMAKNETSFFNLVMQKKWKTVVQYLEEKKVDPSARLTKSNETVLHVAASSLQEDDDPKFIEDMIRCVTKEDLELPNDDGDTPLHLAAAAGSESICVKMVDKNPSVIEIRNEKGETPLFVAAHNGKHGAFLALNDYCGGDCKERLLTLFTRNEDGNNILHSAIAGEFFRLAYWIIENYKSLCSKKNINGETPLHFLARKPHVFKSSRINAGLIDKTIYKCVLVEKLKTPVRFPKSRKSAPDDLHYPRNYETCVNVFRLFKKLTQMCFSYPHKKNKNNNNNNITAGDEENNLTEGRDREDTYWFPPNYTTCVFSFYFALKIILIILGLGYWRIDEIRKQKHMNTYAKQVMEKLIDSTFTYQNEHDGRSPAGKSRSTYANPILSLGEIRDVPETDNDGRSPAGKSRSTYSNRILSLGEIPETDTPLLVAAKHGILEIVTTIVDKFAISIHDVDSQGKSVLLVAAKNRQVEVLRSLFKRKLPEYVLHRVDKGENGILHLGARLEDNFLPWELPGAALQMQAEIKWYQFLKSKLPLALRASENSNGARPDDIFAETHVALVGKSAEWLSKTSESCSVVAALIAGVAFATSASIPGGFRGDNGSPILKGKTNFDLFVVASLLSLCLSVTALVCFLGIITSRHEEEDLKKGLPLKLFLGMSCLFISITAMLVTFCAGQSFMLGKIMQTNLFPVYMTVSIPLLLFLIGQLPLYADLFRAQMSDVPRRNYKVSISSSR